MVPLDLNEFLKGNVCGGGGLFSVFKDTVSVGFCCRHSSYDVCRTFVIQSFTSCEMANNP